MKHINITIHRRRKLIGGGIVDDIVRYTKHGMVLMKNQLINGVHHLVPVFEHEAHRLAGHYAAKGVEHVGHIVKEQVKHLVGGAIDHEQMHVSKPRSKSSRMDILNEVSKSFGAKRGGSIRRLY